MSVSEAITYSFIWHSMGDACPKCLSLNSESPFEDQDIYQKTLYSRIWGDIWDLLTDHSLAHPHCRCTLEVRVNFDWEKLRETNQLFKVLNEGQYTPETISLGEIDLSSVTELKQQLATVTNQVETLEQKSGKAELTMRQEIRTLNIMMMMVERFSGDENLDKALQKVQQFMMILMRLRMTMLALQAASGPWGWLYVAANVAATGFATYDAATYGS